MYEYENNQLAEQEIKLPNENLNNSSQNSFKEYQPFYQTARINHQTYINNNNNDINYYKTSPRTNYNHSFIENRKLNNFPHHHHHIYHIHHHCNSPLHSHSESKSRSGSYSPSPIKNISQPLINPNLNIPNESSNQSKLMYIDENINNRTTNNFNYDDIYKTNNYMNSIYTKKIIDENDKNNSFINYNEDINHWNAKAFDEYMNKLAMNKYNKMKKYNESYYFKKQFGVDENNNLNNIANNDNSINELNIMKKNLEEKYKLYNLITKYDEVKFNNENNKENNDENINNENNEQNINKEYNNKNINEINNEINIKKYDYKKEENINNSGNNYNAHKKKIYNKTDENRENKKIKKHHKKHNRNNTINFSYSSQSDSSPEKDANKNNFVKDDNNKHKIQKTFNENIGQDNNNIIFSSFNHYKKNLPGDYNTNTSNTEKNLNNSNLLDYLKKENEEIKNLNNSYKQIIDTLFYFLNNISCKYPKENDNSENPDKSPKLFDLSKDLNNIEDLSKKLIDLELTINEGKFKNPFNKNHNINNEKKPLLLIITKENSFQLPEPSKLEQFNDLIAGMNEKCFSFKNENFIEKYKNNHINDNKMKNMINVDNSNKNIDQEFIDKINNEGDRCVACLLGCNVSKRGYSPMRYNPYDKNVLRIEDSGDLLDKYNEIKENVINKEKESQRKNERNNNHKIPKSRDNSKSNSLNHNKNSKSKSSKKKIWK